MSRRRTIVGGKPFVSKIGDNCDSFEIEFRSTHGEKKDAALIVMNWWQAKILIEEIRKAGNAASEICKSKGRAIKNMSR